MSIATLNLPPQLMSILEILSKRNFTRADITWDRSNSEDEIYVDYIGAV